MLNLISQPCLKNERYLKLIDFFVNYTTDRKQRFECCKRVQFTFFNPMYYCPIFFYFRSIKTDYFDTNSLKKTVAPSFDTFGAKIDQLFSSQFFSYFVV